MDPLLIIIILALIATVITTGLGLLTMSGGGATDRQFSTKLMWARIIFQGVTLLLLVVAVLMQ